MSPAELRPKFKSLLLDLSAFRSFCLGSPSFIHLPTQGTMFWLFLFVFHSYACVWSLHILQNSLKFLIFNPCSEYWSSFPTEAPFFPTEQISNGGHMSNFWMLSCCQHSQLYHGSCTTKKFTLSSQVFRNT